MIKSNNSNIMKNNLLRSIVLFLVLALSIQIHAQTPGNALNFNTNSYVDCGIGSSLNITNSITIEAWINADSWQPNQWEGTIAGKDNTDQTGYVLRCGDNGRLSFTFGSGGSWPEVTSDPIMLTGQWYHVAGVYDGSMMRIYINGVQSGQNTVSTSIGVSALSLYIGDSPGFSPRHFNGMIDEVSIWNVARSVCDINSDMNQTLNGNETGLVAYYNFDQGTAGAVNAGISTLPDLSSNHNDGALYSFALFGTTSNWVSSGAGVTTSAPDFIIATTDTSNFITTSIDVSGNITNAGSGNITERGICYNTTGCPTTADSKVSESGSFGTGTFTETLTGLSSGTDYFARAYAINPTGTSYGKEIIFGSCYLNIPDTNFVAALIAQGVDLNGDSIIECYEAAAYNGPLDVSSANISDMTGIEFFTNITQLYCGGNLFTSLNLSSNTSLQYLTCNNGTLTTLNVAGLTSLTEIYCSDNQLTTIDVSTNTGLIYLYCYNNVLTSLNTSSLTSLYEIDCSSNSLTSLDVSSNSALYNLYCYSNLLTSLNTSGLTSLYEIDCSNNSLLSLNVSSNTALYYLYCYYNFLTSLNTSSLTSLYEIDCEYNSLTSLDVSSNSSLNYLYCYNNILTSLNISGLTSLYDLECENNSLTNLDVSTNTNLQYLYCNDNLLSILNVKNGNNTIMSDFNATNNPNLTCIQVDDAAYSTTNWTNIDATASFNTNCGYSINTISATVNPVNSGTIVGAGDYYTDETVTLTATANTGYTFVNWTENGTEVSTNAAYSFTATANRTLVANFVLSTDISSLSNASQIAIYPNPNNGTFQVNINIQENENSVIKIYNSLGQEVRGNVINNFQGEYNQTFDLSMFAKGIYMVKINLGENQYSHKVIVE